jgi:hypothetical protein
MDHWQTFRMALAWPLIVAAFTWWLVFLCAEWWRRRPQNAILALIVAATAAITASGISRLWDNSTTFWLWFTIGLFGAAAVMWLGIAWVAMERVRTK